MDHGEWAAKNGSKRVVTLVNEWAPGTEAETAFKQRFTELGGQIVESGSAFRWLTLILRRSAAHP
jgi:ABC-type branched-subunit amino acid transport system substrate-binding protein